MMPTLRRLDDGTRYYFLTWRQWFAVLAGGGLLYAAVRFSPPSQKWTFTAALLALATVAVAIMPLTGNTWAWIATSPRSSAGHSAPSISLAPAARQQRCVAGCCCQAVPVALVDDRVDERVDWTDFDDARPQPA